MSDPLDSFLVRASLAGLGTALAAAPLGCFVVWRRMAYFGDATAHAALLGVALALALEVSVTAGMFAVALAVAAAISGLSGRSVATDTLLGVFAHAGLALGVVAVSFMPTVRTDLMAWLFGDVLSVSRLDLAVIWGGGAVVAGLIVWRWSALLAATVSPELAVAAGIAPRRERAVLTVALALLVATAIQTVGALLIAAMLIIPAAAARPLAASPERMALGAALIGGAAALGGLGLAWRLDTPAGPTMVALAAAAFAATSLGAGLGAALRRAR